jgi:hypothetical protein
MVSLLLLVTRTPRDEEIERRSKSAAADFLQLHPEPAARR